jgi:hypothetical protein
MIDKPDPKDAGRTDAAGAKRPHATIDLKATEVKPPSQAAAASSASSSSASSVPPTGSSALGDKPASSATSASTSPADKSAAKDAPVGSAAKPATPEATAKPDMSKAGSPKASTAAPSDPKAASGSSGGFFSHLAAGIVGGALVYAGAAYLGLAPSKGDETAQLQTRIAALESALKQGSDVEALSAKVGDAESRLAKLDELTQTMTQLRDAQGTLQAETKALTEAAQRSDAAVEAERIAKLEEQLKLIASASEGAQGNVPQLAAISGKISDLESSLNGQMADLRKSFPADVADRISSVHETSEAARSAAQRLDRELSQVRMDLARGAQASDTTKASTDRLTAALEATKEETAKLSNSVGELRSFVNSQIKAFAKPEDVTAAVNPVNAKLAEVEQSVKGVVSSEQTRRENAERIVLSLELSNLKRALDRGTGYGAELEEVRKASNGKIDLGPLDRFKDTGVSTPAQLKAEFRPLINAVLDADVDPADGSVIDRLLSGAKSVVRVRKVNPDSNDTSTEAIVSRIETALNEGRLGDALALAKSLPQRSRAPLDDWIIKVTARDTVDQAIAGVETTLKASLSGSAQAAPATPAPVQN